MTVIQTSMQQPHITARVISTAIRSSIDPTINNVALSYRLFSRACHGTGNTESQFPSQRSFKSQKKNFIAVRTPLPTIFHSAKFSKENPSISSFEYPPRPKSETKMNGVKGKIMKKLKSIKPPIAYLNQDRILQAIAPDGYSGFFTRNENINANFHNKIEKVQPNSPEKNRAGVEDEEPETEDPCLEIDDKENVEPFGKSNGFGESTCLRARNCSLESKKETRLSEIDISSFRPPDMNSGSLFDPNLLEVFQQAVMECMKVREAEIKCRIEFEEIDEKEEEEEEEEQSTLFCFEEKCPPGGSDSVIFYTTTLRGIRKTFEDCNSIRFLLETFRVKFYERDLSMHTEFKEELWRVLDKEKALPPKLFIRGRYIGGAEEVLRLHEQGKLRPLFDGVPTDPFAGIPCEGCGGARFVLCFNCNGSHRVVDDESDEQRKCPECNENGLILCPYCC